MELKMLTIQLILGSKGRNTALEKWKKRARVGEIHIITIKFGKAESWPFK